MAKKLKIAFLSFYSGDVNRGVEAFVEELAARLAENHDVVVFQQGNPKKSLKYKVSQVPLKMDWKKKDMTGTLARRFFIDYWSRKLGAFALKVAPKLLHDKYDIVVPLNGGYSPIIVRLVTLFYGGKMVGVGQSGMGWDERINLLAFPNAFVPLSTKAKVWAKKFNPLVKSKLIPNGVDLDKFNPDGKKYKSNLPPPLVICVSALVPGKRVDLVIKAVARLKNASLLLIGDGDSRDELIRLGEKLLGERFKSKRVKFEEMPNYYRAGDIFTLVPFEAEAFGIVYIEALASNLPVVAIDDSQRKEIIGNAGLLVNPEDEDAYVEVLQRVLDSKWGNKPREQAKKFSWDKIAKKYEKLFTELVK